MYRIHIFTGYWILDFTISGSDIRYSGNLVPSLDLILQRVGGGGDERSGTE